MIKWDSAMEDVLRVWLVRALQALYFNGEKQTRSPFNQMRVSIIEALFCDKCNFFLKPKKRFSRPKTHPRRNLIFDLFPMDKAPSRQLPLGRLNTQSGAMLTSIALLDIKLSIVWTQNLWFL